MCHRDFSFRVMRMVGKQAIVKVPSVEALGCATVVCVDKIETLTQNEMTVKEIYFPELPSSIYVSGIGYNTQGTFTVNVDNEKHSERHKIPPRYNISVSMS